MQSVMNSYANFVSTKTAGLDEAGQDFSAFLSDPNFFSTAPATANVDAFAVPQSTPAFANAFSAAQDALLDSPLGLSPASLNNSPFDTDYDFSPEMDFGSAFSLSSSTGDLPSLFGSAAIHSSPVWDPVDFPAAAQDVTRSPTPDLIVSPAMMRLDSAELAPAPAVVATVAAQKPTRAVVSSPSASAHVKDKFTGTRNTKIPPIDFSAPTMTRSYIVPSATSRKRAPAAITSKLAASLANGKRAKRQRSETPASFDTIDVGEEGLDPSELPDELLSAIELKRRQNTLAARRSRQRKAGHLAEIQGRLDDMTAERDEYKRKCEELEAVVRALRGC